MNTYERRALEGLCLCCGDRVPKEGYKHCSECMVIFRNRYLEKKKKARNNKVCVYCHINKNMPGRLYCTACTVIYTKKAKERRDNNKVIGICTKCGQNNAVSGKVTCEECAKKGSVFNLKRKIILINGYGGKCSCCGESEHAFLSIDHVNGGGGKHRREIGSSSTLYRNIIREGFPKTFQLLCHNCNHGRYINGGICPHKLSK